MSESTRLGINISAVNNAQPSIDQLRSSVTALGRVAANASDITRASIEREIATIQREIAARGGQAEAIVQVGAASNNVARIQTSNSTSLLNQIKAVANAQMEATARAEASTLSSLSRTTSAHASAALSQMASIKAVADAQMRASARSVLSGSGAAGGSLIQNEARHVVALFDEMASNRRGAFISTLGASARDAGLGVAGLTASVAALAAIMGTAAILRHAEALGKWAMETRAAASATGMSLASYSQLQGALTLTGLKGEEADATLRRLAVNLGTAMSDPVSLVAQAFHNLGISQTQITSTGGDAEKALHLLADAFARTQDGANKSAAMNEIFGRGFEKIIPAIQHGGDALDILKSKAQALGITLTNDSAKKLEETGHRIDELEQKIRGKGIQAFVDWSTSIGTFTKSLGTAIDSIGTLLGWIGKMEAAKIDVAKWIGGQAGSLFGGTPAEGSSVGTMPRGTSTLIDEIAKGLVGVNQELTDFAKKIIQVESSGRHLDSHGSVKLGEMINDPRSAQYGKQAVGIGQVMPDVAGGMTKTYAGKTFNLADDVQNIQVSLLMLRDAYRKHNGNLREVAADYVGRGTSQAAVKERTAYLAKLGLDGPTSSGDMGDVPGPGGKAPVPALVKGEAVGVVEQMHNEMAKAQEVASRGKFATTRAMDEAGSAAEIAVLQKTLAATQAKYSGEGASAQANAKIIEQIETELSHKQTQLRKEQLGLSITDAKQATQDFIAAEKEKIAEANGSASKIAVIYDEMLNGLRTKYTATAAQILTIEREKVQAINHARMEEMRNQTQLDERTIRQNRITGELAQIASGRFKFAGQGQQGPEADVQRSQDALQEVARTQARAQARTSELTNDIAKYGAETTLGREAAKEIVAVRLQSTTQEVELLKEAGNAAVAAANKIAAPFVNMFNQIGSQTEQFASSMITAFLAPQKEIIKRGLSSSTVSQQGAEVRAAAKTLFLGITQDLAKSVVTSLSHMAASALSGGVSNTIGELLGNMLSKAVGSIFGSAAGSAAGNLLGGGAGSIAGSAGVVSAVGAGATATVTGVSASVATAATTIISAITASATAIVSAITGTASVEDTLLGSISVQQPSIAGFSLSGGGIIPSAAGGMMVGGTGASLAILHAQEMVLPAPISRGIQEMIGRGGGGGNSSNSSASLNYSPTINTGPKSRGGTGLTRSEFSQMMSSHGGSMFGEMRNLMNNGWRPA